LGVLVGGLDAPVRSAADASPKTIAPKRKARIVARTDMGGPCEPVLLH
jgi:hypothetical protein